MPLSAAVQDLPLCGRGQRGIDFFFKSSPALASPITPEKRDILAYFKRADIAKGQSYKSSLSNDTDDTDCSSLSSEEEEEIKPRKNGRISSKDNGHLSENCNGHVRRKGKNEPANRTKEKIMDSIDLKETEHSGEDASSAKDQNAKICSNSCKLPRNPKDGGTSDRSKDGKTSPTASIDLLSDSEEEIVKNTKCLETESNRTPNGKGEVRNTSPSSNSTENKKNAFTFLMANRAKQAEAGRHSAEERDSNSQESDDECVVVSDTPSQSCEPPANTTESINPAAAKKKSQEVKSDKEKEDKGKTSDLNSSLQHFDLTPFDKPKRKRIRKPKIAKEDNADVKVCLEAAVPSEPPSRSPEEATSNCISFADYMKGARSVAEEESADEESDGKETNEAMESNVKEKNKARKRSLEKMNEARKRNLEKMNEARKRNLEKMNEAIKSNLKKRNVKETSEATESEESTNKCKMNEPSEHQQPPNSDRDSTEDDNECPKDVLQENVDTLLGCDELAKKRKLSCSLEQLGELKEVQLDAKDTEAMAQSKQVTAAKVKRKRTRKRIVTSSDSEEDFMASKSAEVSKKKVGVKRCDKPPVAANTTSISSFFKKISQKEMHEEENKVVFTVQADVHAPLDGNNKTERKLSPAHTQACGESGDDSSVAKKETDSNLCSVKKNTRKSKKDKCNNINLDELNKIELLEQIPPSKPLSKKVLNKVCVEGKGNEGQKMSEHTIGEVCNTVKAKSKVTLASKKGKFTKKGSLSTKNESVKGAPGTRKMLLRRKKFQSASSGEESSDELFIRKKEESEPPPSDKDVAVTSASSSSSNSSSSSSSRSNGSSSVCPEDAEEKSSSTLQSSPEGSEDDKENVAHYTSQLVTRPGKLSLRIKRIQVPQQACRKEKLKLRKANKNTRQLKKVQDSRSNQKRRRLRTTQKPKSPKEEANKDCDDADQTPQVKHDLIIVDDDEDEEEEEDSTKKPIPKKTSRRKKITQTLLKPLKSRCAPKGRLQRKRLALREESPGKSESEAQGGTGTQRRTPRRAAAATAKKYIEEATIDDDEEKPKKAEKSQKKLVQSKGGKLAPIFCKRAASPSVELLKVVSLSPSKLKARQDFLSSSVSDDIRKQLVVEKSGEDEALAWPPFPSVSHVQQRQEDAAPWNLKDPEISLKKGPSSPSFENLTFTQGLKVLDRKTDPQNTPCYHVPRLELGDIVFSLSCMKSKYPDFPVFEVFKAYYELKKEAVEAYQKEIQKEQVVVHLDDDEEEENTVKRRKRKRKTKLSLLGRGKRRKLGSGKETPEETPPQDQPEEARAVWHERTPHMWTQLFMPKNVKQVIGNTENVKNLKLWLQEWKNKPLIKPKKRKKKSSKKEDFVVSDGSTYGDEEEEFVSTYLLTGPPGAGKTAAVYALAKELGYKVLEVNASSRRPGRQVMSQLAEATQSHSVSNTSASANSSSAFSAIFSSKTSSSMTKKENSQTGDPSTHDKDSSKRKGVSLVLFEDIDIVFEEWDEGFMSTVNNFMSTTKRPIILTASHTSPVILSQIKERFEILEFDLPPQKLTAQHLQLVALANGCHICLQDIEGLVHLNKGDVRKSMLDLQLLSQSGSSHDTCDCAVSQDTLDKHTEDNWKEIFPEAKSFMPKKPNQIEFYKVGLRRRLYAKNNFDTFIPKSYPKHNDKEGICCEEIENNINCILPFPVLNEREIPVRRYPLQSNDPLLKRSSLWQYESLMALDDGEEGKPEPMTEQTERKVKPNDPPRVQKASQSCLESLARMYDSLADLDILTSSQIITHEAEIKDIGWWVKQPIAGLSDNPSPSHPHWTPHSNEDIIQELAQKAAVCCVGEVVSALEGVTAKDWPQLCLPCDARGDTHASSCESERAKKRSVMSGMFDHLPALSQVSRRAELDYLPALRSVAREDELGAALGRRRRGRRFLSYFLQMGWSVSPEDRISLANSLMM